MEAICHFNVTREKLPLTYRLLRVQNLPTWANTSAVSIDDVIQVQGQVKCHFMILILAFSILLSVCTIELSILAKPPFLYAAVVGGIFLFSFSFLICS